MAICGWILRNPDEAMAEAVLDRYADLDRLTSSELEELQYSLNLTDDQRRALGDVLGPSLSVNEEGVENSRYRRLATARAGRITGEERNQLRLAGFHDDFINTLAGSDGNEAQNRRAEWLASHAVTRTFRDDYEEEARRGMLLELAAMGAGGSGVMTYLREIALGEDSDDYTPAIRAAAIGAMTSISANTSDTSDDDVLTETLDAIPDNEVDQIAGGFREILDDLPPDIQEGLRRGLRGE